MNRITAFFMRRRIRKAKRIIDRRKAAGRTEIRAELARAQK